MYERNALRTHTDSVAAALERWYMFLLLVSIAMVYYVFEGPGDV
jgi:hypothetical protein